MTTSGKTREIIGEIKENVGELIGDRKMVMNGTADRTAATYEKAKKKKPSNLVPSEDDDASNKIPQKGGAG